MELIDFILHVDEHLLEFITNYGIWIYAILFLIIFVETGLVVMPFLPGDSLLFTAGFLAYAFMTPLAVTSTAGWVRRLGGARWQRLHRRVYGVAILAVIHYLWLVKADRSLPLLYAAILTVLLGLRLLPLEKLRQRLRVIV